MNVKPFGSRWFRRPITTRPEAPKDGATIKFGFLRDVFAVEPLLLFLQVAGQRRIGPFALEEAQLPEDDDEHD